MVKVTSLWVSLEVQLVPIEYSKTFVFVAIWIFPSDFPFLSKVKSHSYIPKESQDMTTYAFILSLRFVGKWRSFKWPTGNTPPLLRILSPLLHCVHVFLTSSYLSISLQNLSFFSLFTSLTTLRRVWEARLVIRDVAMNKTECFPAQFAFQWGKPTANK